MDATAYSQLIQWMWPTLWLVIGVAVRIHEVSPRAFLANVDDHGFLKLSAGKGNEEHAFFFENIVCPVDLSGGDMSDLAGIHWSAFLSNPLQRAPFEKINRLLKVWVKMKAVGLTRAHRDLHHHEVLTLGERRLHEPLVLPPGGLFDDDIGG